MEWLEAVVHTTTFGSDLVSDEMMALGAAGTEIVDRADVPDPRQPGVYWELYDPAMIDAMPDDVLVKRLSGRRVCPLCGAPYHVDRLNGETVCRADGTPLIQRDDDKAETVLNRLAVYHQKTAPLIDHYREAGLLKNIGGGLSLEEISEEIFRTLEAIQ